MCWPRRDFCLGLATVKSSCFDAGAAAATANRNRAATDEQTIGSAASAGNAGSSQESITGDNVAAAG